MGLRHFLSLRVQVCEAIAGAADHRRVHHPLQRRVADRAARPSDAFVCSSRGAGGISMIMPRTGSHSGGNAGGRGGRGGGARVLRKWRGAGRRLLHWVSPQPSAHGPIAFGVPPVADRTEPFVSRVRAGLAGRTAELERLAVEMFARSLSTRDIEAAFKDATGTSRLSRTAVSQVTERLPGHRTALGCSNARASACNGGCRCHRRGRRCARRTRRGAAGAAFSHTSGKSVAFFHRSGIKRANPNPK